MEDSKDIRYILKIGTEHHMRAFLDHGEMFFNTVDWFRQAEMNQERFDGNEGASSIKQLVWIKLRAEDGQEFYFSKPGHPRHETSHGKLASANWIIHEERPKGNIYSCIGVGVNESGVLGDDEIDPRFKKFGDVVVVIANPNMFLTRVAAALNNRGFRYQIGPVKYYDPDAYEGKLNPHRKKISHAYQKEVRIWIENDTDEPLKLTVGSIRDIARGFKLERQFTPLGKHVG
jgi:hypothetical protein